MAEIVTTKIFDENGNVARESKSDYMAAIFYTDLGNDKCSVRITQAGELNSLDCIAVMMSVADLVMELSNTFSRENNIPKGFLLAAFDEKISAKIQNEK